MDKQLSYGEQLKKECIKRGIKQKELAQMVGASKSYLTKIANDRRSAGKYADAIKRTLSTEPNRDNAYGKLVKLKLFELGMTQVQLASMVGTNKQYLYKILMQYRSGEKYVPLINEILGITEQEYKKAICSKSSYYTNID